jgi:hypothetical protein
MRTVYADMERVDNFNSVIICRANDSMLEILAAGKHRRSVHLKNTLNI